MAQKLGTPVFLKRGKKSTFSHKILLGSITCGATMLLTCIVSSLESKVDRGSQQTFYYYIYIHNKLFYSQQNFGEYNGTVFARSYFDSFPFPIFQCSIKTEARAHHSGIHRFHPASFLSTSLTSNAPLSDTAPLRSTFQN